MAVSLSNGDIIATGRVQGSKVKVQNLVDFEVGQTTLAALIAEMLAAKLSDSTADYDATASYAVGAFAKHDGVLYVCKTAIAIGGEAWNPAHWTAMPDAYTLFSSANSSLVGVVDARLPYPINTDGTIKDRAINVVTSGAFVIPQDFKDLLIRYTGIITSLTFTGGEASYGDNLPTDGTATSEYLITVTKIKSGEAYVRIIGLEARS